MEKEMQTVTEVLISAILTIIEKSDTKEEALDLVKALLK